LNLGKYERQHYVGVNPNLREAEQQAQLAQKEAAFLDLILRPIAPRRPTASPPFTARRRGGWSRLAR